MARCVISFAVRLHRLSLRAQRLLHSCIDACGVISLCTKAARELYKSRHMNGHRPRSLASVSLMSPNLVFAGQAFTDRSLRPKPVLPACQAIHKKNSLLQCSAVQCNTSRCSAVQYPLLQCSTSILRTCKQCQLVCPVNCESPSLTHSHALHICPQTMQQCELERRFYNHDVSRTDSCS